MASKPLQHRHVVTLSLVQNSLCRGILLLCLLAQLFTIAGGQLNSILPMNGPLSGGTSFTLSGGSFTLACTTKTLSFNSILATSVVVFGGGITGAVPSYVAGLTAPVTISYAGTGTCATPQTFSTTSLFSYDSPVFNGLLYGSKSTIGGGSITITGNNFLSSGVSIAIGSTSSSCAVVANFISFKCSIPAFSLGSRTGLLTTITMNSVQTQLIKFAYDAPVLSNVLPLVPKLDGMSTVTIFGLNLEAAAPVDIKIGTLSCTKVQMVTPHQTISCVPDESSEFVRTYQFIQVSLFSGFKVATSWSFEPSDTFLHLVAPGTRQILAGTGLSIATAGQPSTFGVLLLDTFSVGRPQRSSCDKVIAITINIGSGNLVIAKSSAVLCQNGTYLVSYIVTKAGKYILSLLLVQG
jgi:hypothetical protein